MIIDLSAFLLAMLPFIVAVFVFYCVFSCFNGENLIKNLLKVRKVLFILILLSCIPAYFEFFTGIKLNYFYDRNGWRYTFLSQNPNQFGVSSVLFHYLVTWITIKYDRRNLSKVFFLHLIFLIPLLYSGSRSSTLVFAFHSIFVMFAFFFQLKLMNKTVLYSIVSCFILFGLDPGLTLVKSKGGNLSRALNIFDTISGKKELDLASVGHSIEQANTLYKANPIFGIGLGNKTAYVGGIEIHNTFSVFLAETGTVGFISFVFLFFAVPFIAILKRNTIFLKLYTILIFLLFSAQNYTGMLLRQRWVWFFLAMSFVIINTPKLKCISKRLEYDSS